MKFSSQISVASAATVLLAAGMVGAQEELPPAEPSPSVSTAEPVAAEQPSTSEPGVEVVLEVAPEPDEATADPETQVAEAAEQVRRSQAAFYESIVEYRTAWSRGIGFLLGDQRTVVVLSYIRDVGRPITVRMYGSENPEVRVSDVEVRRHGSYQARFTVLHTAEDLPGQPLILAEQEAAIGDPVFVLLRRSMPEPRRNRSFSASEVAQTVVTGSSNATLSVGVPSRAVMGGSPVLDNEGRVVAFFGHGGMAFRARTLLAGERRVATRGLAVPMAGLKLGTEVGGFFDQPFIMDVDLGVVFWDQLGITVRLGFAAAGVDNYGLAATDEHQAGVVAATQRAFNAALEAEYRWLLWRSAAPLYLDLVAGAQYTTATTSPTGVALYSADTGCDPRVESCTLASGPSPADETEQGVGLVVGADLRIGSLTFSYRFIPEAVSYRLPNTHRWSIGVSMF